MKPVDRSYIRVKSFVVLVDDTLTRQAVWLGHDPARPGLSFHRPLGGSVELGEYSHVAAVREIQEELGVGLDELDRIGVLENVFQYDA